MKGIKYILGCLLVWLVSCQQHEVVNSMEDLAELTFKLDLADAGSRALADGDCLNLVSVYIVDAGKAIVASQEDISVPEGATEVTVTFDKSYNLVRGMYTLMAVANHGTLPSFSSTDYNALMNSQVHATGGTGNISPKDVVQPLSLMKEIELHAGKNNIDGELVRTFARFRIEVKNNSGNLPLRVNGLSFSNNFTQQNAYVFDDGTDRKYFGNTGAPVSTSSYARTPFTKDAGKNYKEIPAQGSAVLFDSYLLESKVASGSRYTYTMDLTYAGASTLTTIFKREGNAITKVNNLGVGSESYFLIYNPNSKYYLNADGDNVGVSSLSDSDLQALGTHCVWQLIKEGNGYYIKNVETGTYIQAGAYYEKISLGTNPVKYNLGEKSNLITLLSNGYYLRVNGKSVEGYHRDNQTSTYFQFFKVAKTTSGSSGENINFNDPISLTTINPVTQQSSITSAIKRNDFINVLVTVSYNPVAGQFEFWVQDWYEGGGNVEFN